MPNANMFCMSLYRILHRFPPFGESGQVPFVHPIDLWYFPSRESTENPYFSCAFAGSKAPKNLTRTKRLPALKNQRKSNEPPPFGRDGLLAEARFKDLLLFFHSLPAPPAVRAYPRTRPGEGLKFFDSFSRKTSSNMLLFKGGFDRLNRPSTR